MIDKIIIPKIWGSEEWIANNDKYCGKILTLNKGMRCSVHYHKEKHETFYVLDGRVLMELGDDLLRSILDVGNSQVVETGQKHRFTGLENSRVIEFSTHHDDYDSYRSTESGSVDLIKLMDELKEGGLIA